MIAPNREALAVALEMVAKAVIDRDLTIQYLRAENEALRAEHQGVRPPMFSQDVYDRMNGGAR